MTTGKYILVGHTPTPEPDLLKWGRWLETAEDRIVKQEQIGRYFVSTIFLGLDHRFGEGPPLLFETMVFAGRQGGESWDCKRCCTWAEAEAQHAAMVAKCTAADTAS